MHQYMRTTRVFLQFLARDWYLFRDRIRTHGLNYILIYPILAILIFAYIQPGVYFGQGRLDLMLFAGNVALTIFSITNNMITPLLFDLTGPQYINYQLLLLGPRLILLEQLLFTIFYTFIIMLPYFPLTYLLLSFFFTMPPLSWPLLFCMILVITIFCATFNLLAICMMKSPLDVRQFWLRVIWPMLVLGGLWVPWAVINKFSPWLGMLCYLNPFIYATEGLRATILQDHHYFSIPVCILALLLFSIIFLGASFRLFKKKIDHI